MLGIQWNQKLDIFSSSCELTNGVISTQLCGGEDVYQSAFISEVSTWQENQFVYWVNLTLYRVGSEPPFCYNLKKIQGSETDVSDYINHFQLDEMYYYYPYFIDELDSCQLTVPKMNTKGIRTGSYFFLILLGLPYFIAFIMTLKVDSEKRSVCHWMTWFLIVLSLNGFFIPLYLGIHSPYCKGKSCAYYFAAAPSVDAHNAFLENFTCRETSCTLSWHFYPASSELEVLSLTDQCWEIVPTNNKNYTENELEDKLKRNHSHPILLHPSNPTLCKSIPEEWNSTTSYIMISCGFSFIFFTMIFSCILGFHLFNVKYPRSANAWEFQIQTTFINHGET